MTEKTEIRKAKKIVSRYWFKEYDINFRKDRSKENCQMSDELKGRKIFLNILNLKKDGIRLKNPIFKKSRGGYSDNGPKNTNITFQKDRNISKNRGSWKFENFQTFEIKKDGIWLKKPKFKKQRKIYSDNGSKNTHIKFQKDRSMGTLSKIGGTERLEDGRIEETR